MSGETQTTPQARSTGGEASTSGEGAAGRRRSGSSTRWALLVGAVVLVALLLFVIFLLNSKVPEDVYAPYGRRQGFPAAESVNGTSVLAQMFQERGHQVSTWKRVSPRIEKYQTIVWFPDRFGPPPAEARAMLEQWLADGYQRTLVYVGRDYDAEIAYWEMVAPNAPAEEADKIRKRLREAKSRHAFRHQEMPAAFDADWFLMRRGEEKRKVAALTGPWSRDVDAAETWIEVRDSLEPLPEGVFDATELLRAPRDGSGSDILAMKLSDPYAWGNSKVIAIANGSFLLNMPLVNHEHRKLAGALIDECRGNVLLLESGPGAIEVRETEVSSPPPIWVTMLTVWPLNLMIYHIALCGAVLCFAVFPIFGRPRETEKETQSDFSKHIDAMGVLLAQTEDYAYAKSRITYYHEKVKRDSGVSHREAREKEGD